MCRNYLKASSVEALTMRWEDSPSKPLFAGPNEDLCAFFNLVSRAHRMTSFAAGRGNRGICCKPGEVSEHTNSQKGKQVVWHFPHTFDHKVGQALNALHQVDALRWVRLNRLLVALQDWPQQRWSRLKINWSRRFAWKVLSWCPTRYKFSNKLRYISIS